MKKKNNVNVEETCKLIDKVIKSLKKHKVNILTNYKLDDKFYLITDFMIVTYTEKNSLMDISFHISTRPDVAAFFTLVLTDFDGVKDINVMEVFMNDENGKILTGNDCIEKNQKNMKNNIIGDFIGEQTQIHYLQNSSYVGKMC